MWRTDSREVKVETESPPEGCWSILGSVWLCLRSWWSLVSEESQKARNGLFDWRYIRCTHHQALLTNQVICRRFGPSTWVLISGVMNWAEMTGGKNKLGAGSKIQSSAGDPLILRPRSSHVDLQNKADGNTSMRLKAKDGAGDINWQSYLPGGNWGPRRELWPSSDVLLSS